jgi:transposase
VRYPRYRSTWAAEDEADIRTVVDTARLGPGPPAFGAILKTIGA